VRTAQREFVMRHYDVFNCTSHWFLLASPNLIPSSDECQRPSNAAKRS